MQLRLTLCTAFCLLASGTAWARTITLTAEDCEEMACISAITPRLSWAGVQATPGVYDMTSQVQLAGRMALLLKFPLHQIPKDQRILKAELTMHAQYVAGKARIQARRLVADWGTGVCHQYRRTYPKKEEWSQVGGLGAGTDRAAKDSGVFNIEVVGDHTIDITEDIELWYTGAAANRGWIFTLENEQTATYIASPYAPHAQTGKQWKLRITFEPK